MDLSRVTAAGFRPFVGDRFEMADDGAAHALELVQVAEGAPGYGRSQFTLTFVGGPTPPLAQAVRTLRHAREGDLVLFLVPIGPDARGQRYEAAFG